MNTKKPVEIMRSVKDAIRQPFAWPGMYQKSIILSDGDIICPDCAKLNYRQIAHDTIKRLRTGCDAIGAECLWEGENNCVQCSKNLSVY
jgi:hypothetical protein